MHVVPAVMGRVAMCDTLVLLVRGWGVGVGAYG